MKVLTVGDPHFKKDNIHECDMFIAKLDKLIDSENPDLIIILGDVLHTHETIDESALNKAYEFINLCRKKVKTYIIVGNHDYRNNSQFLTTHHWMNGIKEWDNCVVVDNVVQIKDNDMLFTLLPYVPPGRFLEALNSYTHVKDGKNSKDRKDMNWRKSQAIFCHQEFKGCKMGAIISIEGDEWDVSYPQIISGHIHNHQIPQENIYYTGSAMQNAFGESEKNIIPIFTFTKSSFTVNEVDLGLPRKKIIYTDIDNINEMTINTLNKDKVKVSISGTNDEFKSFKKTQKYKELVKDGVKVVFKSTRDIINKNVDDKILFNDVMYDLVKNTDDKYIMSYYNKIIHNIHNNIHFE